MLIEEVGPMNAKEAERMHLWGQSPLTKPSPRAVDGGRLHRYVFRYRGPRPGPVRRRGPHHRRGARPRSSVPHAPGRGQLLADRRPRRDTASLAGDGRTCLRDGTSDERERRMTDLRPEDFGATPTLEVRAYRDGTLFDRTLCESEEDAAVAVAGGRSSTGSSAWSRTCQRIPRRTRRWTNRWTSTTISCCPTASPTVGRDPARASPPRRSLVSRPRLGRSPTGR